MKSAGARISTLTAAGILGLGVGATPALGQTHTLNLSAPSSTAAVGQTIIIQASGSNEQEPIVDFSSYLTVVAIPTSVLSACPADYSSGKQVARSTSAQGGEVLDEFHREEEDAAGNFSMPVAYTPGTPGRFLICGYSDDAATTTLAMASLALTVEAALGRAPGPDPAAKPASVEEAACEALREEARLPARQLVEQPEPLLLRLARERQAEAGRAPPDARHQPQAARPQGPVQGDGAQRRRRDHRAQPAAAHPLNLTYGAGAAPPSGTTCAPRAPPKVRGALPPP